MRMVYNLIMIDADASYDNHKEAFNIGFFSDREGTEKTAKKYLSDVDGFKDYNISCQIIEKRLIGYHDCMKLSELFIIYGWNENEESDSTDVIESDCYVSKQEAEQQLEELKSVYSRKEWCIDPYRMDECCWQEGFLKLYY